VADFLQSIKVKVLYFGMARDAAGGGQEEFSFSKPISVDGLLSEAEKRHVELVHLRKVIRVAVNEELTSTEVGLQDGDVVAILPPVAGG
jgi:molybdopterin converting factor subunit 1